jgi:hypothetical protein
LTRSIVVIRLWQDEHQVGDSTVAALALTLLNTWAAHSVSSELRAPSTFRTLMTCQRRAGSGAIGSEVDDFNVLTT